MLLYLQGVILNMLFAQPSIPKLNVYGILLNFNFFIKYKLIDLPSIFSDKLEQSFSRNYFKNSEVPVICFKYNKPIRNTIFNFNKLCFDLDIETSTPDS